MSDGTVGIRQDDNADRLIDNLVLTIGGNTVYRQRVASVPAERETRLDYDVRVDSNPVYVGTAEPGTAAATETWTIKFLEYDATARLTRVQVLENVAWDDRTTLGWS